MTANDDYTRAYYEKNRPLREALAAKLDRTPFGERLALQVWVELMRSPEGQGLIHQAHRDYCGHGLIRTAEGVILCEIQDGYLAGPALAAWHDRDGFVGFFARQSDWSCSGWDPQEPAMYTDDPWRQSNQRLTREILARFAMPEGHASDDARRAAEDTEALRALAAAEIDRTPFGEKLARKVWRELSWCRDGEGIVPRRERDYRGLSFMRAAGDVILCEIENGEVAGPAIARWRDREAFVAFLQRQSDWSCAGWDATEPVFFLEAPWRSRGQRPTRAMLRRFVPFW